MFPARLSLLLALAASGCVGGAPDQARDKEALRGYELDAPPPSVGAALNVDFDGKLTLLGAKVEPAGTLARGQQVKLTLYWQSRQAVGEGWGLFTHVLDGSGERVLNIDNVGPLREWRETRQALPPSAWTPGKVYVDEQSFEIPADLRTSKLAVVVGVWKQNSRLAIKSGPVDGDNRALVATLHVSLAERAPKPTQAPTPSLRLDRVDPSPAIQLDGQLDEPAWAEALSTGPFVDVSTGKPALDSRIQGSTRLIFTREALYLGFEVRDPDVVGDFPKGAKDPHLWTKDCVEIMVDPDGDGDNKDYYEIQVNPQGLVFDSRFDDYNSPKQEPNGPFGHQEWSARVEAGVRVKGTLNDSSDRDEGWVAELKLPWKVFEKAKRSPPAFGDEWRFNFYAMENNGGVAWSPILRQGNFHKASRFGRILFGEKGALGYPPPSTSAAPSASASASASAAPSASAAARASASAAPRGAATPPGAPPKARPKQPSR